MTTKCAAGLGLCNSKRISPDQSMAEICSAHTFLPPVGIGQCPVNHHTDGSPCTHGLARDGKERRVGERRKERRAPSGGSHNHRKELRRLGDDHISDRDANLGHGTPCDHDLEPMDWDWEKAERTVLAEEASALQDRNQPNVDARADALHSLSCLRCGEPMSDAIERMIAECVESQVKDLIQAAQVDGMSAPTSSDARVEERRAPWQMHGWASASPYDPYPSGRRLLEHYHDRRAPKPQAPTTTGGHPEEHQPHKETTMSNAIEIPMDDCGLTINVGKDGVWLHFNNSKGQHVSIHAWNVLGGRGGIIGPEIGGWCEDREEQARQIAADNGQFGVGA